jgi:hypothetical protein
MKIYSSMESKDDDREDEGIQDMNELYEEEKETGILDIMRDSDAEEAGDGE